MRFEADAFGNGCWEEGCEGSGRRRNGFRQVVHSKARNEKGRGERNRRLSYEPASSMSAGRPQSVPVEAVNEVGQPAALTLPFAAYPTEADSIEVRSQEGLPVFALRHECLHL